MKSLFFLLALALAVTASTVVRANEEVAIDEYHHHHHHPQCMDYEKAQYLVTLLYRAALFREPDPGGLSAWTQQAVAGGCNGLVNVASGIGSSPEFLYNVYAAHSTTDILSNLYGVLLERQVDPSGWAYWLPMLDQRRGPEVLAGIVSSEEFRNLYHIW